MIMKPEQVKAMTDEQLRIKVAELCGWKYFNWAHVPTKGPSLVGLPQHDSPGSNGVFGDQPVPDYPHDLNAMHEAWNRMTEEQKIKFSGQLELLVRKIWRDQEDKSVDWFWYMIINATARQRAETFVLTMDEE